MKKNTFKKVIVPIVLVIVIATSSVITIWSAKKTDALAQKENEAKTTVPGTAEINPENTTVPETEVVNKDNSPTTTKKSSTDNTTVKAAAGTTTTKKATTTTTKASKPVTTTKKAVTTTKKPKTTKKAADEYYPALTQADINEAKQYCINYIKQRGYKVEPQITWSNAGYSAVTGMSNNLSIYGNKYKVSGGIKPVEYLKARLIEGVDMEIESSEEINGPDSVQGLYPLFRQDSDGWSFTVGYWQ